MSAIKLSEVSFINQTIVTNKEATLVMFIIFTSLLSLGVLPSFLGFLAPSILYVAPTADKWAVSAPGSCH